MEIVKKNPTFFVDIDGTIIKYRKFSELKTAKVEPIQDVINFLNQKYSEGAVIIITTARPQEFELFTKQELENIGLKYHQIVMNCGRGTRVILNDKDPYEPDIERAVGINLLRDQGFTTMGGAPVIDSYESI